MKAVYHSKYGTPDVLSIADLEKPVPAPGEILVKVQAATVNRTDCAILSAKPFIMRFFTGFIKPRLPVTGTDFAGSVVAVGEKVSGFQTGERVYGFNDLGASSHAEYLTIAESNAVCSIPENISFIQAAASVEAAHWAYNIVNKTELSPGAKVLINGAGGGIGSALVQLSRYYGAIVTAVCRPEHFDALRALGVEKLIDYTTVDMTLDSEKYDFIFDAVGKSSYFRCKHMLKEKGTYISSEPGLYGQNLFLPLLTSIRGGKKVIFPVPKKVKDSMAFVRGLLTKGKFTPLIDRAYPINQVKEAFTYVASGKKMGNVILLINGSR